MIEMNGLSFGYKKSKPLFSNLNLTLSPGNIYGLLGKNGAGKTSLLKIISGLLFTQSGTCRFNGLPVSSRDPEILQNIFFLPETSYLPHLKIEEYLNYYSPFYPKFDRNKFIECLDSFEVPLKTKTSGISYGQKKKVSIAFALASNSKLLLLDEPTNGLDIPAKSTFRKLIASSVNEERLFLISTHQVQEMKNLFDPVIILDEGKILFNETVAEIESRLKAGFRIEKPQEQDVLYYESTIGGYLTLTENEDISESEIDIELLFKAVCENGAKIRGLFEKEKSI